MEEFTEILEALEAGDLSAYSDEQLADARKEIHEYGKALKDTDASGEDLAQLVEDAKTLKSAMSSIDTEMSARAEKATKEKAEKDEAFAAFEDEEETEEETEEEAEEASEEAEEVEEKEPVAAAAVVRRRGEIRRPPDAEPKEDKPKAVVAAALGNEGFGNHYKDRFEAAEAMMDTWSGARAGRENQVLRIPVKAPYALSDSPKNNWAVLQEIRHDVEHEFSQGKEGLTAAGFCAPVQPVYDFFDAASATAGSIDLPEANAPRGQVSHPEELGPTNLADTAGIGTNFTAADDVAGTEKTCYTVDCGGTDIFEVSADYTCLRFSNFDELFYPERVAHVMGTSMVVAAHNTNSRLIGDIVTSPRTNFINSIEDGGGAWVNLSRTIARESAHYRERHKLPEELTLDVVLPYWFAKAVQTDTTARDSSNLSSGLIAAMAQISSELAKLNVRVQFVYDWQSPPGQEGAFDGFVSALMYAPGSVVRLRGGAINVGTIRDSVLNLANDFQFFEEEFTGIATPGYEIAYLSGIAACPTGATGARVTITCAGS